MGIAVAALIALLAVLLRVDASRRAFERSRRLNEADDRLTKYVREEQEPEREQSDRPPQT